MEPKPDKANPINKHIQPFFTILSKYFYTSGIYDTKERRAQEVRLGDPELPPVPREEWNNTCPIGGFHRDEHREYVEPICVGGETFGYVVALDLFADESTMFDLIADMLCALVKYDLETESNQDG